MRTVLKKSWLFILMAMAFLLPNPQKIVAVGMDNIETNTNRTTSIMFVTNPLVSETELATEMADGYLTIANDLQDAFGCDIDPSDTFFMGQGISAYRLTDEGLLASGNAYFPICSGHEVLFFVTVGINPETGEMYTGCRKGFSEKINNHNLDSCLHRIIEYDDMNFLVGDNEIIQLDGEEDREKQELISDLFSRTPSETSGELYDQFTVNMLTPVCNVNIDETPRTLTYRGFSVNDTYYKILEMAYCNSVQRDSSGNERGLCWAATAATMIRYRTGNRTVSGWRIADLLRIEYNEGGTLDDMYRALNAYGAIEGQYRKVLSEPSDALEIKHNINNQFPIGLTSQTGTYLSGLFRYGRHGHAVTIIGYREENSRMTLIYWNSATCNVEVTEFNPTGSTYFNMNAMRFKWEYSLMVPLYSH